MRINFLALALAALLASPQAAFSHGTERHYGNPYEKRAAAPASPAFSMMLIDNSLSAIRRVLTGESEDSVEERIESIARSTASLLQTTSGEAGTESDFASFAEVLEGESARLRSASPENALRAVLALKTSFDAAKRLYQSREQDS